MLPREVMSDVLEKVEIPSLGFRGGKVYMQKIFFEELTHIDDLPQRYIINKGATILFWGDGSKTIVKRCKDDKYNKRLGFLTAYFQKHCGMSKNKANKYLASLVDEAQVEEKRL